MKRLQKYKNHGRSLYTCPRCENDEVVRQGLSYSPSDMARLNERGLPVNSLNTSAAWIDGEENPSFHVGSERERFVDVADLWEQHQLIRDKARNAARSKKSKHKSE